MYTVRVEPIGIELKVVPGESVFAAARRLGYQWPTICEGKMTCLTCALEIHAGAPALEPITDAEHKELMRAYGRTDRDGRTLRLACQTSVVDHGLVVFKRGVGHASAKPS